MENNETKKTNNNTILIIVMGLIIIALSGYIIYGKTKSNEPNIPDKKEEEYKSTITKEKVEELNNSLMTPSKEYGLYFDKSVTIDNIDDDSFLEYVLENYVKENNITLNPNVSCLIEDYCHDEVKNLTPISKSLIDNYIKTKFNTNREFTPKKIFDKNNYPNIANGNLNGYITGEYYYDMEKQVYYFGTVPKTGDKASYNNKLVNYSEDENNVYIYDKYLYCFESGASDYAYVCNSTPGNYDENNALLVIKVDETSEYLKCTGSSNSGVDCTLDYEKVMNDNDSKLNTYKHTFKKDGNNYYWVSSEIVK